MQAECANYLDTTVHDGEPKGKIMRREGRPAAPGSVAPDSGGPPFCASVAAHAPQIPWVRAYEVGRAEASEDVVTVSFHGLRSWRPPAAC